jgi:hypothetical protein
MKEKKVDLTFKKKKKNPCRVERRGNDGGWRRGIFKAGGWRGEKSIGSLLPSLDWE